MSSFARKLRQDAIRGRGSIGSSDSSSNWKKSISSHDLSVPDLSPPRAFFANLIGSAQFDAFMAFLVVSDIGFMIYETDSSAQCFPSYEENLADCPTHGDNIVWLRVLNLVLLTIYLCECATGIYCHRRLYFRNAWNNLDFFVVATAVLSELFGGVINFSFLKVFRIARLMRAFRTLMYYRELYLIVAGFLSAMKAIFWGTFLIAVNLTVWSILLVEWVHPLNVGIEYPDCERCPMAYRTVMWSNLTLFQHIITGDSWGETSIPIIERHPWTALFFVSIVFTVSVGLTNLIMSVMVSCAAEAREKDIDELVKEKEKVANSQKAELLRQCSDIDEDGSGNLSLDELTTGYDNHPEFRHILKLMDVEREELQSIFKILDTDCSGDVSYYEFVEQLHKFRSRDQRTMLMFMRLSINDLTRDLHKYSKQQSDLLLSVATRLKDEPLALSGDTCIATKCAPGFDTTSSLAKADDVNGSVLSNRASCVTQLDCASLDACVDRIVNCNSQKPTGDRAFLELSPPPFSLDSIMADIDWLQQQAASLVSLKDDVLRKTEQQETILASHVTLLTSMSRTLPQNFPISKRGVVLSQSNGAASRETTQREMRAMSSPCNEADKTGAQVRPLNDLTGGTSGPTLSPATPLEVGCACR